MHMLMTRTMILIFFSAFLLILQFEWECLQITFHLFIIKKKFLLIFFNHKILHLWLDLITKKNHINIYQICLKKNNNTSQTYHNKMRVRFLSTKSIYFVILFFLTYSLLLWSIMIIRREWFKIILMHINVAMTCFKSKVKWSRKCF